MKNKFGIARRRTYYREEPTKEAKKIYIFCEGKTEYNYFRFFQGLSSNLNIISIRDKENKSAPTKLIEDAKEKLKKEKIDLNKKFEDQVWFVVDTDKWREQGQLQNLKQFVETKRENKEAWNIAISNRSFEIWRYYHLSPIKPNKTKWNKHQSFKNFITNEIKIQTGKNGFHNKEDIPIGFEIAILNTEKNFATDKEGYPTLFSTEVFRLAKVILPFVKDKL